MSPKNIIYKMAIQTRYVVWKHKQNGLVIARRTFDGDTCTNTRYWLDVGRIEVARFAHSDFVAWEHKPETLEGALFRWNKDCNDCLRLEEIENKMLLCVLGS